MRAGIAALASDMPTLAQIQAAFASLSKTPASCYLVNQDDYDALEAATTATHTAEELERGRCAAFFPSAEGIRLIPSRDVARGSLVPLPEPLLTIR